MLGFLLFGFTLTMLLVAGAVILWRRMGDPVPVGAPKRRHREEARQLQMRLDEDEDFTQNFHRPTQNEILETLQALDYLTPGWDEEDETLTDGRFKNELAESFPAVRRSLCAYPQAMGDDAPPPADPEFARLRAGFHAARARANAQVQMSTGPAATPVALPPGSLPFRVAEERQNASRQTSWVPGVAVITGLVLLASGAYFYVQSHAELKQRLDSAKNQVVAKLTNQASPAGGQTVPPPSPSSTPVASPTPTGSGAIAAVSPVPESTPSAATPEPGPTTEADPMAHVEVPTPPEATAAPTPKPQIALAQQVAASQQRAVERFPDLAVADSEINMRFIFRYKALVADKSPRLQDPNWPEKLAEECARAANRTVKPKNPTPGKSTR